MQSSTCVFHFLLDKNARASELQHRYLCSLVVALISSERLCLFGHRSRMSKKLLNAQLKRVMLRGRSRRREARGVCIFLNILQEEAPEYLLLIKRSLPNN
ncbi:hypothetical protein DMENIID0001_114910 [Sergentomyia squamirostris]